MSSDGTPGSPFLEVPSSSWLASNASGFVIPDKYPVADGHSLVVPRRMIATWWEASLQERNDLWDLVDSTKEILDRQLRPDGYNIGFNAGTAAGQTVEHLHIHVIPRFDGDVRDPRGGIRHVIPGRGNYLAEPEPVREPFLLDGPDRRLLLELFRCLMNERLDRIDLVVSFIMKSGLEAIRNWLQDAVDHGARLRVLTSGYLEVTDPDALARLLDLVETGEGNAEVRAFDDPTIAFHPKAYLFWASDGSVASGFVGSSNLSRSGIDGGVEWNIGVAEVAPLVAAFDRLWADQRTVPVDHAWLARYRERHGERSLREPVDVGVLPEPPAQPAEPRELQREVLDALEEARVAGHRAGLVVMATGLGKTWVAAFDSSRPQFRRVLYIAHREEILRQSLEAFRAVTPDAELGLFVGEHKQPDADVVFASIQTLANRTDEFAPDEFDYVVVDEFHHAAAPTYRKVIDHFEPAFMLGLTATPERMDSADLLSICGDNLVYDCDLIEGIRRGELVPFHYYGIRDVVDFAPIPWRNGRFEPEALAAAVETQDRAEQAFEEWSSRAGDRTLAFCVSTAHADFMARYFEDRGVPCASVHSGPSSDPRRGSVEDLSNGTIEVLFAVDVFNEGFDLPAIDTVLMLRPTASPVVFLQQLGRGLRIEDTKEWLTVIDFIGNHRSFLAKPQTLLSLGGRQLSVARLIEQLADPDQGLPEGCSITWELGVVELLEEMAHARTTARSALTDYVLEHVEDFGERPSAMQAHRSGYNPATARPSWFELLAELGVLSGDEREAVDSVAEVLRTIQRAPATKAYKLVTIRAMTRAGRLREGIDLSELCRQSRLIIEGDPRLVSDMTSGSQAPDPLTCSADAFEGYWRKWPVAAWTGELSGSNSGLFRVRDGSFVPTFEIPASVGETYDDLVAELIDWRLAAYLESRSDAGADTAVLRVSHSSGNPILRFDRDRHPHIPEGWTEVMAEGEPIELNFVKIAVNVARRADGSGNALHSLLRGWFGPDAGAPGTNHEVLLERVEDRWILRPRGRANAGQGDVIPLYPSFEVACGSFDKPVAERAGEGRLVRVPGLDGEPDMFAAVAGGDSMAGGDDPVRDGDIVLFRWHGGEPLGELIGRRVLVQYVEGGGRRFGLKKLAHSDAGYELHSTNPSELPIAAVRNMRVVGTYLRTVRTEEVEEPDPDKSGPRRVRIDGEEIDATFEVERVNDDLTVVVHSAGGTRGTSSARNLDYVQGVDKILERAASVGLTLVDAYIDTTQSRHLTLDERRLDPGDSGYPVDLSALDDPAEVRSSLLRSMAKVGRAKGNQGSGNARKRFRLVVSGADLEGPSLADQLRTGG